MHVTRLQHLILQQQTSPRSAHLGSPAKANHATNNKNAQENLVQELTKARVCEH